MFCLVINNGIGPWLFVGLLVLWAAFFIAVVVYEVRKPKYYEDEIEVDVLDLDLPEGPWTIRFKHKFGSGRVNEGTMARSLNAGLVQKQMSDCPLNHASIIYRLLLVHGYQQVAFDETDVTSYYWIEYK